MATEVTEANGATGSEALSYRHICTQTQNEPVATSWRDDRAAGEYDAKFYRGGSLIEVKPKKPDDADDTARASALRGALREDTKRRKQDDDAGESSGAKRGKVTVFSAKSRRRMHLLLGKVDAGAPCLFLTLTVSDAVEHDGRSMKAYLRRFKARLARKFPVAGFIWRLEPVKRKSGRKKGQPVAHYHGLLWGVPCAPGLHEWVHEAWSGCTGAESRVQIEAPRSSKGVMAYCAKLYMTKPGDEVLIEEIGRHWGTMGEGDDEHPGYIPFVKAVRRVLSFDEANRLLRTLRAWVKADRRSHGRRGKVPYLTQWRAYFVPDVGYWADRLGKIIGALEDPTDLLSGLGRVVEVRAL